MKVFVTGATGFIGSAVVRELLGAGHEVLGLARSEASAAALQAAGAEVQRGALEDPASLEAGARACEGIVHTGFVHDFSRYVEACELDRRVIATLGSALRDPHAPLVVTSGTLAVPGRRATEDDRHEADASRRAPRAASEEAADALVQQGRRVGVVRPSPSVHGEGDHGLVPMLIQIAKERGASAYIGDGTNRWNAVHRLDAARVFVRALERATPGARFHAVAEPEIPFRDIAAAIGELLHLPVIGLRPDDAEAHFGWLAWMVARDGPASSALTQAALDWTPSHPTLLDDLASGAYVR
ncbi:MAG: SDR family oxidoreductase [Myxococcales bacterium]|nr:SDR family oxidoreductase [Myxococcales bacterium]MCB9718970.1 SDR family oxidoreductase [Myxococcales bacterium]